MIYNDIEKQITREINRAQIRTDLTVYSYDSIETGRREINYVYHENGNIRQHIETHSTRGNTVYEKIVFYTQEGSGGVLGFVEAGSPLSFEEEEEEEEEVQETLEDKIEEIGELDTEEEKTLWVKITNDWLTRKSMKALWIKANTPIPYTHVKG